jgi:hypothetical protein
MPAPVNPSAISASATSSARFIASPLFPVYAPCE